MIDSAWFWAFVVSVLCSGGLGLLAIYYKIQSETNLHYCQEWMRREHEAADKVKARDSALELLKNQLDALCTAGSRGVQAVEEHNKTVERYDPYEHEQRLMGN